MCTVRELHNGNGTKFIWWYVAVLVDDDHSHRGAGEEQFNTEFFPIDEAVQKLRFETDREVLRRAIQVVTTTEQE